MTADGYPPAGKPLSEWTREQRRAYIAKQHDTASDPREHARSDADCARILAALDDFTDSWCADASTLGDIGPSLTCNEANALADLLRAVDQEDAADALISSHAEGDDEGDAHFDDTGSI